MHYLGDILGKEGRQLYQYNVGNHSGVRSGQSGAAPAQLGSGGEERTRDC